MTKRLLLLLMAFFLVVTAIVISIRTFKNGLQDRPTTTEGPTKAIGPQGTVLLPNEPKIENTNKTTNTYNAVDFAYQNGIAGDTIRTEAEKIGLTCGGYLTNSECGKLTRRIHSNKKLFSIFQYAKSKEIMILVTGHVQIGSGIIEIDENMSDTKMIKFLSTGIIP